MTKPKNKRKLLVDTMKRNYLDTLNKANLIKEAKASIALDDCTQCGDMTIETKGFNLSEKIQYDLDNGVEPDRIDPEDVKEFIRLLKEEDNDLSSDVVDLLEINKVSSDIIQKIARLFLAYFQEKDKLAGDKLI